MKSRERFYGVLPLTSFLFFSLLRQQPSACLALWRIEKVDFEEAAVFPELPVEDALEEVKTIMRTMTPTDAARTKIVS